MVRPSVAARALASSRGGVAGWVNLGPQVFLERAVVAAVVGTDGRKRAAESRLHRREPTRLDGKEVLAADTVGDAGSLEKLDGGKAKPEEDEGLALRSESGGEVLEHGGGGDVDVLSLPHAQDDHVDVALGQAPIQ